jgi:hypothetical protein
MATEDPSDDTEPFRIGSPIRAGLTLLGIYIAMYLAVGGVVRVLTPPDAATAVASCSSMAHASATASSRPDSSGDSSSRHDGESSTDGYPIHRME